VIYVTQDLKSNLKPSACRHKHTTIPTNLAWSFPIPRSIVGVLYDSCGELYGHSSTVGLRSECLGGLGVAVITNKNKKIKRPALGSFFKWSRLRFVFIHVFHFTCKPDKWTSWTPVGQFVYFPSTYQSLDAQHWDCQLDHVPPAQVRNRPSWY